MFEEKCGCENLENFVIDTIQDTLQKGNPKGPLGTPDFRARSPTSFRPNLDFSASEILTFFAVLIVYRAYEHAKRRWP